MKMKRLMAALAAVSVVAAAMTGCTSYDKDAAITNTENVTFTATPSQKGIKVETENGKQTLEIVIDKDLYDPTMLSVDDYNFDGYMDIAFPANYNENNVIYQLWLYNTENGQFEEYTSFPEYYGPTLDVEAKQINTVAYTDPVTTSTGVYEWRDGEMFCLEMKTVTQNDNGEELTIHLVYNEETGEMEVVEEETAEEKNEE